MGDIEAARAHGPTEAGIRIVFTARGKTRESRTEAAEAPRRLVLRSKQGEFAVLRRCSAPSSEAPFAAPTQGSSIDWPSNSPDGSTARKPTGILDTMLRIPPGFVLCGLALTCGGTPGRRAPKPHVAEDPAPDPPPPPSGPCASWWGCTAFGLCHLEGDVCRPAQDADCARSWACKAYGDCRLHDGECAPVPKGGRCRGLGRQEVDPCATSGRCTPVDGLCMATEERHCEPITACTDEGSCSVMDGVCAAAGDDVACRESDACRSRGLCRSEAGRCVAASDEDCAASTGCAQYGACRRVGRECLAGAPVHCEDSSACREAYRCTYAFGYCWASAENCARATQCEGGCPYARGGCELPLPTLDFQL